MNHPAVIRDLVLTRTLKMLEHLCLQVSSYHPGELAVLKILEMPSRYGEAEALANFVMTRLGAPASQSKEPKYDKMHRLVVKKRGRPPRGEKSAGPPVPSDALQQEAK